ncbi:MAG: hypothetical protein ACI8UO_000067 [Verrucomicrobiales bacterium]|jgi:hypothetical protein
MKTNTSVLPRFQGSIWKGLLWIYQTRPSVAIFAFTIATLIVATAVKSEVGFWFGIPPAAILFATVFNLLEHLTRALDANRKFVATVLACFSLGGAAILAFDGIILLIELSFML